MILQILIPYNPTLEAALFESELAAQECAYASDVLATSPKNEVVAAADYFRSMRERMWKAKDIVRDVRMRGMHQKLGVVWG